MAALGVVQAVALWRVLRALPPTVTLHTGMAGLVPMGVAVMGFGTLALGTPPAERPRRRGERPRPDRAQKVTALGLACLALFHVLTMALRLATAGYLETGAYHRGAVDPGFHARFLTAHVKTAARGCPSRPFPCSPQRRLVSPGGP